MDTLLAPAATLANFIALPEGTPAQLIDGGIIVSPAPSAQHQVVVSRLGRRRGNFVEEHGLGEVV